MTQRYRPARLQRMAGSVIVMRDPIPHPIENDPADPDIRCTAEPDGRSVRVELMIRGRSVSRCWIVPQRIRIGRAVVRMDGIGGVGTDARYRRRGYARRVLDAAQRRMRQGDAGLSMLYGIPDFYERYGYVQVGPEHSLTIPARETASVTIEGWSCRPGTAADLDALADLYSAVTEDAVGAAVRTDASLAWRWMRNASDEDLRKGCCVAVGPGGDVRGYALLGAGFWAVDVLQREHPRDRVLAEVIAADPEAASAMLDRCAAVQAMERRTDGERYRPRVLIPGPPDTFIARAALRRDAVIQQSHTASGGSMACVLNATQLLQLLVPELQLRLRNARRVWRGRIILQIGEERIQLRSTRDRLQMEPAPAEASHRCVPAVSLTHAEIALLALGATSPDFVLWKRDDPIDRDIQDLLAALFPQRHPHMHLPDRY